MTDIATGALPAPSVVADHTYELVVSAVDRAADGVVTVTLARPDGGALAHWTPGAHLDLVLPCESGALTRQYSLCSDPGDLTTYRVGVLREPESRGGSAWVHAHLTVGSSLSVAGPRNHFELVPDATSYLFIGGGIGITPMLPMIAAAAARGVPFELYYVGRARASMAFLAELEGYADSVHLVPRDEQPRLDIAALLAEPVLGRVVYCCGPTSLLDAVEATMRDAGWASGALHTERFEPIEVDTSGDEPFDVVLERSGRRLHVPSDKSIFEVVREAGVSVLGSCLEGTCGTCETDVTEVEGALIHRDAVLSDEEQASEEMMMLCVSRCSGGGCVTLDL